MSLLLLFQGAGGGAPPPTAPPVSHTAISIGIRIGVLVLLLLGVK